MNKNGKSSIAAFAAAYLCMLALFCLGISLLLFANREESISRTENRTLQAFPALTGESFFSGVYMDELESWMTDNVFSRDALVSVSKSLLGVFDITSEEEVALNMEENLAAAPEAEAEDPTAESTALSGAADEADEAAINFGDVAVADGYTRLIRANGEEVHNRTYPAAGIRSAAAFLNEIRSCLGPDGSVYFLASPISTVINSVSQTKKYSSVVTTLDDEMQPLVSEGITVCDEVDILGERIGENVFSVLDHHWTALGASCTADWMIGHMGLAPAGYYDYHYHLLSGLNNASYTRSDLAGIAPAISDLQFQIPLAPYDFSTLSQLDTRVPCNYLADDPGGYWDYALYMGGCHGPYRLLETGFHTGRNALVIGDSFFHAFVPYLAPYYDTILMLDPRSSWYNAAEAGAGLRTYMEQYETADVFFITCDTGTAIEGDTYSKLLPRILAQQP